MEKIYVLVALVLGCLFAGNAEASSERCEGCSDSQFIAKAKQLGVGEHVITSFSTNQVKIFNVWDSSGGEPGVPVVFRASPVAVSAAIQESFNGVRSFYLFTNGTMKAVVLVDGADLGVPGLGDATTAYDVMTNANLRAQLGDRLATGTLPGLSALDFAGERIVQGVFGFFGAGDASIEITVYLSDGSTLVYKVNTSSYTGQYQEDRSRTSDGQLIPEANTQEYQGTWGGGAQPELGNYMRNLGSTVTYIGSGTNYGSMSCTWIGTTLKCTINKF